MKDKKIELNILVFILMEAFFLLFFFKENLLNIGLGIILGLVIGSLLTFKIVDTIEVEMVRFLHHINVSSYINTCLLIMLFTITVNVIIHFYLRKIDMIESLKSVE